MVSTMVEPRKYYSSKTKCVDMDDSHAMSKESRVNVIVFYNNYTNAQPNKTCATRSSIDMETVSNAAFSRMFTTPIHDESCDDYGGSVPVFRKQVPPLDTRNTECTSGGYPELSDNEEPNSVSCVCL